MLNNYKVWHPCDTCNSYTTTTTTSILRPFFWDHPGEPVP